MNSNILPTEKLNLLGIAIVTKNRSEFIIRQLYYYVSVKCPYTVYIGDSSNEFHLERLLSVIDTLKDKINIVHKYYPDLNAPSALKQLVGIVIDKYVVYTGDDDYLIPNSLQKCVSFLEDNPKYTTAHGHGVVYSLVKDGTLGNIGYFGEYQLKDSEPVFAKERLLQFLDDYWVVEFSVRLTKNYIQACDERDIINDSGFAEIVSNCISILQGKSKKLNCLYLIREVHDGRNQGKDSPIEWITSANWNSAYHIYHQTVVKELMQQDDISERAASKTVRIAFQSYLYQQLHGRKMVQIKVERKAIKIHYYLKKYNIYRFVFSEIKRIMFPRKNKFQLNSMLNKKSPFYKDFTSVYKYISEQDIALNSIVKKIVSTK